MSSSLTTTQGQNLLIFWPWPLKDLVLASNYVASGASGNCNSGSVLLELTFIATLYFINC